MTIRHRARVRAPLAGLEDAVMRIVWQQGRATVESVHGASARTRDLKEVTVRTILRRLEDKGYVRHDVDGRTFVYEAVEPARSLAGRAVKQIIDRFCQGSLEELVTGMVDANVIDDAELQQLEKIARRLARSTPSKKER
jgi:BlaI family transcriptional regulator, penicillinase repressor